MGCDVGEMTERLEIELCSSLTSPNEPPMASILGISILIGGRGLKFKIAIFADSEAIGRPAELDREPLTVQNY